MKPSWREAALLAVVVALLLEFGINLVTRQTVWQRLDALEYRVRHLETIHEQEDQLLRQQNLQKQQQLQQGNLQK